MRAKISSSEAESIFSTTPSDSFGTGAEPGQRRLQDRR